MQYSTLAPELSATVNLVSVCIISVILYPRSNCFFKYLTDTPSFRPAERPRLSYLDFITDIAGIAFVMDGKPRPPPDVLLIERVLNQSLNHNHHRFIRLVADDRPDHLSFFPLFFHDSDTSFSF